MEWEVALLNVLAPFLPVEVPKYGSQICLEYWENEFDQSIDVAMRFNGYYQPIFIEHYVESLVAWMKSELCVDRAVSGVLKDINDSEVFTGGDARQEQAGSFRRWVKCDFGLFERKKG